MQRAEMSLGRHTLSIETGRLAKQADGAAHSSQEIRPNGGCEPAQVDGRWIRRIEARLVEMETAFAERR